MPHFNHKINLLSFLIFLNSQLLFVNNLFAQDSTHIQISLLTCTPSEELYTTFGHSALRVKDSSTLSDVVYNYGTFNFEDDNFYLKFIKGKLMYYVSVENFQDFKEDYQLSNRGITEQVLNLSSSEKTSIKNYLLNNIKDENKFYKYDFFFDNCTTRLRDIIEKKKDSLTSIVPNGTRFRQAIHDCLNKNNKQWSKLGIDLLLGEPTDAVMTTKQSQFLPINLMETLDTNNNQYHFVASEKKLFQYNAAPPKNNLFSPLFCFSAFSLFIFLLSFSSLSWAKKIIHGIDGILFFTIGLVGLLLLFMWFGTDHAMCKNNFNLLWALPTHAIMAFFIGHKQAWVKKYFLFTSINLVALLFAWNFLPQQMNIAFTPIILLLIYRSYRIYAN